MNAPLAGLKVLDLSRVLAGPWCTQLLADLGADVVKIERPGVGDDTRHWGPPWHEQDGQRVAAYFLSANRGKKSAAIDFSTPQGAQLVRRLAERADIVVENFKVGGLERLGLGPTALRESNPSLIIVSITGFGQDGPYADRAGYDYIIQAMGGLMSVTGQPDQSPGGEPLRVGVAVADLFTGLYATIAVLAALHARSRTGAGTHIDMALFDTQLAMLANQGANALVSGVDPPRQGNSHPNIVPYQPFQASDRPIVIAIGNDRQFGRLARLCDHPEWATDQRFATNAARVENRAALVALLAERIGTRTAAEWFDRLDRAGIPAGPINSVLQALGDVQAQHRGMVRSIAGGALGPVRTIGSPVRFDGERCDSGLPPPALGEHTDELLAQLGLTTEQVAALKASNIVA